MPVLLRMSLQILWYRLANLLNAHTRKLGLRQLVTSGPLVLAMMLMAMPLAAAQTNTINTGIFGGGSTLASQSFRELFDCYMDKTVAGDGLTFSDDFNSSTPTPGLLPTSCMTGAQMVEGLYAAVGSGNGTRAYISNAANQLFGGTATPPMTFTSPPVPPLPSVPPFPSVPPPYVDSNNMNVGTFCAYPYSQMDVGFSDAPLLSLSNEEINFMPATGWLTGCTTVASTITAASQTPVSFDETNWGNPIQLPAFEVAVSIAVNTANTAAVTWTINSEMGTPAPDANGAGSALQITTAQLCAVFSGSVTDWSSTQSISVLTTDPSTGVATLTSMPFNYANTINGTGPGAGTDPGVGNPNTPQGTPYVDGPLPITVVFRSDGSGTSFIITNFLHNFCPLLDDGTNNYTAIFASGPNVLPSTNFSDLIADINAVGISASNFIGENGSGGVAATISDTSATAGAIGYLSADFTFPYANTVSGAGLTNVDAPRSAAIQNENERISGVNVPGEPPTMDSGNFRAPTPASADTAWQDPALVAPATDATFDQWNVYAKTFPTGTGPTPGHGGVNVSGLSILPLTNQPGAYPLAGTTYMFVYSCYSSSTRANTLVNFLDWLYGSGTPAADILVNNGFHALTPTWSGNLMMEYLTSGSPNMISSVGAGAGCPAGAMGAH